MKKKPVVIDTNVLVSSLIGQSVYSKKIFEEIVFPGKVDLCLSTVAFREYTDVLERDRFKKFPGFTNKALLLLESIKELAFWYSPQTVIDVLDDKDDNKFIELAVEARAAFIVTGNSNDFVMKNYGEITICSPREFYENEIRY